LSSPQRVLCCLTCLLSFLTNSTSLLDDWLSFDSSGSGPTWILVSMPFSLHSTSTIWTVSEIKLSSPRPSSMLILSPSQKSLPNLADFVSPAETTTDDSAAPDSSSDCAACFSSVSLLVDWRSTNLVIRTPQGVSAGPSSGSLHILRVAPDPVPPTITSVAVGAVRVSL